MKKSWKRTAGGLVVNLILVVISIAILLLALEGGTRLYLKLLPTLTFQSHLEFRRSIPAPYLTSPYNVTEFVDESFSSPGWRNPPGTRLVIPNDFHGKYIGIEAGLRRTSFQPAQFKNRVFIFGGSTIFCNEVPDDYTLPSVLQIRLNKNNGNHYRVENYGATSVVSAQELERLRTVSIKEGDVVIFYDGANDAYTSIYKDDPTGWIVGENKQIIYDKGVLFETFLRFHTKYSSISKFVEYFLSPFDYSYEPAHLRDEKLILDLQSQLASRYQKNILEAARYTIEKKAKFIHVLQPTLFQNTKSLWYRHQLASNTALIPRGMERALVTGYQSLQEVVKRLNDKDGILSFDLSNISEQSQLDSIHFLDWVHLGDRGNEIMADEVYKRLLQMK